MTNQLPARHNARGFTLIETIIYVGLFAMLFTGIFVSIYPFFTGATRLTQNILTDGETAFVLAKLQYGLTASMTSSASVITTPAEGATADKLIIKNGANEVLHIEIGTTCTTPSPLVCKMLMFSQNGAVLQPLNADHVQFDSFSVRHYAPNMSTGAPRYLEVSFTANRKTVGPIRYYLNF